jgi:hypothetical protein
MRRPIVPQMISRVIETQNLHLDLEISVYGRRSVPEMGATQSLSCLAGMFDRRTAPAAAALIRGLEECERGDVHQANELFFGCLTTPDAWFAIDFRIGDVGYVFSISERQVLTASGTDNIDRACLVIEDYCANASAAGDGACQSDLPPVIEALCLAAVRCLCLSGRCDRAQAITHRLLAVSRHSIYLRSAEHAIGMLVKGETVPIHLRKFVSADKSALADRFCPVPFARADIHQSGEVAMCCTHWLPTTIGNVFEDEPDAILNSAKAKEIRRSVVDGTFKYCSHTDCPYLVNDELPRKQDYEGKDFDDEYYHIEAKTLADAFAMRTFAVDNISYLIFCLDRSCNLTCPSCRVDLIMVKGEERDRLYDATERAVLPMLKNAKRLMVNPSGEVFVSRPSRRLLECLGEPGYEHLVVDIITNGTVCDKAEWQKFSFLYGSLGIIRVSVDGASKEVFEKLRRGAKYESFVENMNNLAAMHQAGHFKHFFMSFTYQRDNFFEMEDFVRFARSFGSGTVIFERLQNIGTFTGQEYHDRAVHLVDHPNHTDFLRIASRVKQDPIVSIDFDPGSIELHGAVSA